jgi:microcin C transport system substrate-binding protein
MDFTQYIKKMDQKATEITIRFLGTSPPYPSFWQLFHSENAWKTGPDGKRVPVPDTNNVTMSANSEMDKLIDAQRVAQTEDEVQRLSWAIAEMVHEEAAALPGWEAPSYRHGYWRWVRWPKDGNLKRSQTPYETHVHWLDPEIEAETRAAMREGKTFPETLEIHDQYR